MRKYDLSGNFTAASESNRAHIINEENWVKRKIG
jgi:hypothetical protein